MGQRQRGLRSPPRQGQEKGKLASGRGPEPEPRWPLEGKVAAGHLSLPSASWARGARRVVCPRSAASRGTGRRPGLSPAEGRRPEVATGSLLPSGSASCCPRQGCLPRGDFQVSGPQDPNPAPLPSKNPCQESFMKPAGQKLPAHCVKEPALHPLARAWSGEPLPSPSHFWLSWGLLCSGAHRVPQEASATGVASLGAWWPWHLAERPLLVGGPGETPLRPSPFAPPPHSCAVLSLRRRARLAPSQGRTGLHSGPEAYWQRHRASADSTQAAAPGAPGARPSGVPGRGACAVLSPESVSQGAGR